MTYTDTMVETLLTLVISTGAHLAVGQNATTKWLEVYKLFFENEEALPYKAKFYKVDQLGKANPRNVRDKYSDVLIEVSKDMETGNKSAKEGDEMTKIYKLVKQIKDEIDNKEEDKQAVKLVQAEDKEKLESNEEKILGVGKKNKNTAVGVKSADGTVVVDEERAAKRAARQNGGASGFETKLFEYMATKNSAASAFSAIAENITQYAIIEARMLNWCNEKFYTLDQLVYEAFLPTRKDPPEGFVESIEAIGGKFFFVLIRVYSL